MGFLGDGETLIWDVLRPNIPFIRDHGLLQFLHTWNRNKERTNDTLFWGDEIEYLVVAFDDENKTVKLDLAANELLLKLHEEESKLLEAGTVPEVSFKPEYGRFQIEVTPGSPYGADLDSLLVVEPNMRLRRQVLTSRLNGSIPFSLTHFPLMGVDQFTLPAFPPKLGGDANSIYTPDEAINMHRRFGTLTKNIRLRKGSNVAINMPIFVDKNTKIPEYDKTWWAQVHGLDPEKVDPASIPAKKGHVYADSMAFGMGMCCLQVTFQLASLDEARDIYDQFIPLTPIMLALTAATPTLRGFLLDTDVRWDIISAAVDDRTPEELGLKPLEHNQFVIDKSRYASVSSYLSKHAPPEFNDIPLVLNEEYRQTLLKAGVDDIMARHIAHLFIRDPLVVYEKRINIDDEKESDHFENVQSTNWQTVRFKPPPPHQEHIIGWRVEFRPMEINFTDFENAAHAVFVALLMRVIRHFNLNLYMPLSKVDENMHTAHKRDAVLCQKFWFRTNIVKSHSEPAEVNLLTIDEIIHGSKKHNYPGFLALIDEYLSATGATNDQLIVLRRYLSLVSKRASGAEKTNARWIRDFVAAHPSYKHDSVVSQPIVYDLFKAVHKSTLNGSK